MPTVINQKSAKYTDLEHIYAQCSGPGGLKLAEFIAEKMRLQAGKRLLDVGTNRGYQTCFLAKEYNVSVVGIDPGNDRSDGRPHVDHLMDNARVFDVSGTALGIRVGLPDTRFAKNSFDYVYSTTTLEMVRGSSGESEYLACLAEIFRVLRPGGLFGLGEPMHLGVEIPADLVPYVTQGNEAWVNYFVTLQETMSAVISSGFEILEANYAPDARLWWEEYAEYDPFCRQDPDDEPKVIQIDGGRWLSFGYVIARKPS